MYVGTVHLGPAAQVCGYSMLAAEHVSEEPHRTHQSLRGSARGRRPDARPRPQASARSGGSRRTARRRARAASGGRTTCRSWRRRCPLVLIALFSHMRTLPAAIYTACVALSLSARLCMAGSATHRSMYRRSLCLCAWPWADRHTPVPAHPLPRAQALAQAQPHSSMAGVRGANTETSTLIRRVTDASLPRRCTRSAARSPRRPPPRPPPPRPTRPSRARRPQRHMRPLARRTPASWSGARPSTRRRAGTARSSRLT